MTTPLSLGASPADIAAAGEALGITFPPELVAIWTVSNGLELPGGWQFFPVFDARDPRRTTSNIVYENTKGRWEIMDPNLIAIAAGDTGNALVLRRVGDQLDATVLLWNHETRRTKRWSKDLAFILAKAEARLAKIESQVARSKARSGRPVQGGEAV